jgi:Ca-activated chloride channel family protein
MTFIWPDMLLLLLLIPLFGWLYLRMQRQRQQMLANYGNLGFVQNATGRSLGIRRHIPPLLFLIALAILIVALARPQADVSVPHIEGTVILAFDVSGSMAADDLKPTRIEAAKAAAQDFVERQPSSVAIGVVSFSDNGFSVQVPTNNETDILAAINRLTPQRGTSIANGILVSLTTIATARSGDNNPSFYSNLPPTAEATPTPVPKGTYIPGVIVLLTDGENNENPDPLEAAQAASDQGVRIYTVGIGSAQGTNLNINGFSVFTALDEDMLQQISQLTDGTYYNADTEQELLNVYDHLNPELILKPEMIEVTPIFAGVSIFVLLLGGIASLAWFGRLP